MLKDEKEMCEGVGYKNVACDFGLGRSWCEVARCEAGKMRWVNERQVE